MVARIIATSPAGVNLLLIGGFRYRLLDHSQRFSVDIDYHWDGDLEGKQMELLSLCQRTILGEVRRELGYDGSASIRKGPDADSPNAKFIDLRFWNRDWQIEVPVEITKILCLDPPTIRTVSGTVHATPSDQDQIESKIIAVFNRIFLQHRDLLDIFLYAENLRSDSPARLQKKLKKLHLRPENISARLLDLQMSDQYHVAAIQKVIDEQFETTAAQQLGRSGGKTVLDGVLKTLTRACPP
jgi:hypothetical protein